MGAKNYLFFFLPLLVTLHLHGGDGMRETCLILLPSLLPNIAGGDSDCINRKNSFTFIIYKQEFGCFIWDLLNNKQAGGCSHWNVSYSCPEQGGHKLTWLFLPYLEFFSGM